MKKRILIYFGWFTLLFLSGSVGASFVALSASPGTISAGDDVTIEVEWTGDPGVLYILTEDGDRIAAKQCSQYIDPCILSANYSPFESTRILAEFFSVYSFEPTTLSEGEWVTLNVSGSSLPRFTAFTYPTNLEISTSAEFEVRLEAENGISELILDYGDGELAQFTFPSPGPNLIETVEENVYVHFGRYEVSLMAEGEGSNVTIQSDILNVYSPLDIDGDGVMNEDDICPTTRSFFNDFVAISGDFPGCSCEEIADDELGSFDDDPCTRRFCAVQNSELVFFELPIEDGGQPEYFSDGLGVDYYCLNGQLVEDRL